jgi:hypothetical protein
MDVVSLSRLCEAAPECFGFCTELTQNCPAEAMLFDGERIVDSGVRQLITTEN